MKKIYLLLSAALVTTAGFAQYKSGNGATAYSTINHSPEVIKTTNDKAAGDSLFYFDSEAFYLVDPADQTDFVYTNEDYDGNNPNNAGAPLDFAFYYNPDPLETPYTTPGGDFFPHDLTSGVDSAFFIGATSWFSPAGTANNWFNMGPVTIPANTTGNTLTWYDKHNPAWTDSYEVFLVSMSNLNDPANPQGLVDVTANALTPVFARPAILGTGSQPASDTSWTMQSVSVDAFVGDRVFIFFNHNTPDGDVIYLDEVFVTEGTPVGIEELNTLSFNVFPNPSTGEFNINLSSENSGAVNLTVKNVVGQTVINKSIAVSGKTRETISLADYSKGIYFLTIDNKTVKLIVE